MPRPLDPDLVLPAGARLLRASDLQPREPPSLSALPFGRKLLTASAENVGTALNSITAAPWRVLGERIDEDTALASAELFGVFRAESAMGSVPFRLAVDPAVVAAVAEVAMGGTGAEEPFALVDRPLSAIERNLFDKALTGVAEGLSGTLASIFDRPFTVFAAAADSLAAHESEKVTILRLTINLHGYSGELRIEISSAALAVQLGNAELQDSLIDDGFAAALKRELQQVEILVEARLEPQKLMLEQISGLAIGSTVAFAASPATPVRLNLGGLDLMSGELARLGDRLAVRLIAPS